MISSKNVSILSNFFDTLCPVISLSKFKRKLCVSNSRKWFANHKYLTHYVCSLSIEQSEKKIKITISVFLYADNYRLLWVLSVMKTIWFFHIVVCLHYPCQIIHHIITKWMLSTPITFSKPHSVIKWTNKVIWFAETEFPEISHG